MTDNPKFKLKRVILTFGPQGIQLAIEKQPFDLFTKDEELLQQAIYAMELMVMNHKMNEHNAQENAENNQENPNLN